MFLLLTFDTSFFRIDICILGLSRGQCLSMRKNFLKISQNIVVFLFFCCLLNFSVSFRWFPALPAIKNRGPLRAPGQNGVRLNTRALSALLPLRTYGRQAERRRHGTCPGDQHSTTHHDLLSAVFPEHAPHLLPDELCAIYHHLPTMSIGYL